MLLSCVIHKDQDNTVSIQRQVNYIARIVLEHTLPPWFALHDGLFRVFKTVRKSTTSNARQRLTALTTSSSLERSITSPDVSPGPTLRPGSTLMGLRSRLSAEVAPRPCLGWLAGRALPFLPPWLDAPAPKDTMPRAWRMAADQHM